MLPLSILLLACGRPCDDPADPWHACGDRAAILDGARAVVPAGTPLPAAVDRLRALGLGCLKAIEPAGTERVFIDQFEDALSRRKAAGDPAVLRGPVLTCHWYTTVSCGASEGSSRSVSLWLGVRDGAVYDMAVSATEYDFW